MKPPEEAPPRDPRIDANPDFVAMRHQGNSLKRVVEKYPDGLPDHIVARALGMTERQVWGLFGHVMKVLRKRLGVEVVNPRKQ